MVGERDGDSSYLVDTPEATRKLVHAKKMGAYKTLPSTTGVVFDGDDDFGEI